MVKLINSMDNDILTILGGLESPADTRDINLGKIQPPVAYPAVDLLDYSGVPVYYQNGEPDCGGEMGAAGVGVFEFLENASGKKLSRRFVYALCKKYDGFPPDAGTDLRSIMKVLQKHGVPEEQYFPTDISLPVAEFADWTKIPQSAYDDALPRQIKAYGFLDDVSWENLRQARYQNKILFVLKAPWVPNKYPGGHFILLNGHDENRMRYRNSFGATWGTNGDGWLTEEDAKTIKQAATAIDLPDWMIKNLTTKLTLVQKVLELMKKLVGMKKVG